MSSNLERRYRRVLRVLPGWYRQQWEEDMVAAFLDSWLTGNNEADEYISDAAGPGWAETASVTGLAVRLYLGGTGKPRRSFAWGQAARNAVLAVMLVLHVTGNGAWVPDFPGLCCIVLSVACLAHTPRIRSRQGSPGSGVSSLTLALLAAGAAPFRIISISDYLHNPHLINVSLAELLILLVAAALVVPGAARAQAATSAPPSYPRMIAA
jgi:hypothetical protein